VVLVSRSSKILFFPLRVDDTMLAKVLHEKSGGMYEQNSGASHMTGVWGWEGS
jgi:hypothetical protein